MTEHQPPAVEMAQLSAGEQIEVWEDDVLLCRGVVEQTAPGLGVAWIRQTGLGARTMICAGDHQVRYWRRRSRRTVIQAYAMRE